MTEELDKKLDKIVKHVKSLDAYNSITVKNLAKSFVMGLATGLGATIGLAIVISILSFFVQKFGGLPLIGRWFVDLGSYLRK